jgi:hypothetical protein
MNDTLQLRSADKDRADTGLRDHVNGKNMDGKEITLARSRPLQLQLFQTFLPEDQDKYSNTIELYDAIPKYFPSKHMGARRIHGTYLPILTRSFEHKSEAYKLEIRPASASSSLNFGVEPLQFYAGVLDAELPVDAALSSICFVGPSCDFGLQFGQCADATVAQTLAR